MTIANPADHICGDNIELGDQEYDHASGEVHQHYKCAVCGNEWWQNAYSTVADFDDTDLI